MALPAVEGLKGKHAIYLVAEGDDCKFTLHGLGFAKTGMICIILLAVGKEYNSIR